MRKCCRQICKCAVTAGAWHCLQVAMHNCCSAQQHQTVAMAGSSAITVSGAAKGRFTLGLSRLMELGLIEEGEVLFYKVRIRRSRAPPHPTCSRSCCHHAKPSQARSTQLPCRCCQAKGEVRAVGTASAAGIVTAGHDLPLGLSAFEAMSGSTMRRPTANIWTTKGETLLDLINAAAGKEAVSKCALVCTGFADPFLLHTARGGWVRSCACRQVACRPRAQVEAHHVSLALSDACMLPGLRRRSHRP